MARRTRLRSQITLSEEGLDTVLVVGGDSVIGGALVARLDQMGLPTVWTTRRRDELAERALYLDFDDEQSAWSLPKESVTSAVLCAAVTSVEACESNPDATRKVNVDRTLVLAERLLASGTFVTFLSTDLVFDGQRSLVMIDQTTNSATQYGQQKSDAEEALLGYGDRVAVVRLGKVISPRMPLFTQWIEDLESGNVIHPFNDLVLAPISLDCVVSLLVHITANRQGGIFHATGPVDITYADAAYWIADRIGVDRQMVSPVDVGHASQSCQPVRHRALDAPFDLAEMGLTGIESLQELFYVQSDVRIR